MAESENPGSTVAIPCGEIHTFGSSKSATKLIGPDKVWAAQLIFFYSGILHIWVPLANFIPLIPPNVHKKSAFVYCLSSEQFHRTKQGFIDQVAGNFENLNFSKVTDQSACDSLADIKITLKALAME